MRGQAHTTSSSEIQPARFGQLAIYTGRRHTGSRGSGHRIRLVIYAQDGSWIRPWGGSEHHSSRMLRGPTSPACHVGEVAAEVQSRTTLVAKIAGLLAVLLRPRTHVAEGLLHGVAALRPVTGAAKIRVGGTSTLTRDKIALSYPLSTR